MPRPEHFQCCNCDDIGFEIDGDPYDVVSGSPYDVVRRFRQFRPYPTVRYCLRHYNERVLAALEWVKNERNQC